MEYVYAAMLLHAAEKEIDDKAVSAVLKAAGVDADSARVKALVASLGGVDIAEAMATAVAARRAASAFATILLSLLRLIGPAGLMSCRFCTDGSLRSSRTRWLICTFPRSRGCFNMSLCLPWKKRKAGSLQLGSVSQLGPRSK